MSDQRIYAFSRFVRFLSGLPGLGFLRGVAQGADDVARKKRQVEYAKSDIDRMRGK